MFQKKYRSKVISILNPSTGIYTLEFESFSGNYKYHPGQFLHLATDSDYDGSSQWPDSRCFSIQTSPYSETIKITYAVKGKYTKQIENNLKVGSEVWLKLPYGDLFNREHNKENTVFLAGGTGLTPFLSLFNDPSFANYINPNLFVGFKNKSMNIYQKEIEIAHLINPSLFLNYVYEDDEGFINLNKVLIKSKNKSTFFISGPPLMIKSLKGDLIKIGISDNAILTDDWE